MNDKEKKLYNAITNIDDEIISESESFYRPPSGVPARLRRLSCSCPDSTACHKKSCSSTQCCRFALSDGNRLY